MSGQLTNFGENALLTWGFTAGAVTRPTVWSVGLFTAAPGPTGGGTEVSGGGYARTTATFSVSGGNPTKILNTANIEFPTATASWGSIVEAAIFDGAGNMWAHGTVNDPTSGTPSPQTINSGNIFRFNAGDLELDLT